METGHAMRLAPYPPDGSMTRGKRPRVYRRPPVAPVGLTVPPERVLDEWGGLTSIGHANKSLVLYGRQRQLRTWTADGFGRLVCWNDKVVRWEYKGRTVINLRANVPASDDNAMAG